MASTGQRLTVAKGRREVLCENALRDLNVLPITFQIAELAGRLDGQQAAKGIALPFEDLMIGATALSIDFHVLTLNLRHFQLIQGLVVLTL